MSSYVPHYWSQEVSTVWNISAAVGPALRPKCLSQQVFHGSAIFLARYSCVTKLWIPFTRFGLYIKGYTCGCRWLCDSFIYDILLYITCIGAISRNIEAKTQESSGKEKRGPILMTHWLHDPGDQWAQTWKRSQEIRPTWVSRIPQRRYIL